MTKSEEVAVAKHDLAEAIKHEDAMFQFLRYGQSEERELHFMAMLELVETRKRLEKLEKEHKHHAEFVKS